MEVYNENGINGKHITIKPSAMWKETDNSKTKLADFYYTFTCDNRDKQPKLIQHIVPTPEQDMNPLILFIIVNILFHFTKIKNQIGLITGIFIFLYGFFRFFIEFYREPDPQLGFLYLNLTLGQMLCFIMLIIGILIIVNSYRKPKII